MITALILIYLLGIPITVYFTVIVVEPKHFDDEMATFVFSLIWPLFIIIALPYYFATKHNFKKKINLKLLNDRYSTLQKENREWKTKYHELKANLKEIMEEL